MTGSTAIVDYGIGNVLSVCRAVEHCDGKVLVTSDPADIRNADRLILPGVGAFGDCIASLSARGLIDAVKQFVQSKRPFLGICVGMQLLFDYSEEFGHNTGLGIIPGYVRRLRPLKPDGSQAKVPFIGWAPLAVSFDEVWHGSWLSCVDEGTPVYFVNSYGAQPDNKECIAAQISYGSECICAAVVLDNITGVQFHPEKSGPAGLRLLRGFLNT